MQVLSSLIRDRSSDEGRESMRRNPRNVRTQRMAYLAKNAHPNHDVWGNQGNG